MKQIIVLLLSTAMGVIMMSCKESATNPPEEKPPGYQEDIPWPSLADSPWPMYRKNPSGNCLSSFSFLGATSLVNLLDDTTYLYSPITFFNDTLIVCVIQSIDGFGRLVVISIEGKTHWEYSLGHKVVDCSAPLVLKDSIIVVSNSPKSQIICLKLFKGKEWETTVGKSSLSGTNVDKEGTIFTIGIDASNKLVAIKSNGQILWEKADNRFRGTGLNSISISPEGDLLLVSGGNGTCFFAIDAKNGKELWSRAGESNNPPQIFDAHGNIYFSTGDSGGVYLFSINRNGLLRWKSLLSRSNYNAGSFELALDYLGNIYAGCDTLHSFDYYGILRWRIPMPSGIIDAPITIDRNNDLIIPIATSTNKILVINKEGVIKREIDLLPAFRYGYPLVISKNISALGSFRGNKLLIFRGGD